MEVLPFRMRGTRVWIFASRFFTFALISDTICTPLLLATVCGIPVVGIDEYGVPGMRVGNRAGVFRAGRREGEVSDGRVVDRLIGVDGDPGAGSLVVRGVPNPARCSKADFPASEELSDEVDGRGVSVTVEGMLSESRARSESWRSEGGRVCRRSSSEF